MNSKQFQDLFDIVFLDSVKKVSLDLFLDINFFLNVVYSWFENQIYPRLAFFVFGVKTSSC